MKKPTKKLIANMIADWIVSLGTQQTTDGSFGVEMDFIAEHFGMTVKEARSYIPEVIKLFRYYEAVWNWRDDRKIDDSLVVQFDRGYCGLYDDNGRQQVGA